jgi:hypothetical protein|nr:MAG TPA: Peptide N-methyltransferase [Caudoviricetes sp.]
MAINKQDYELLKPLLDDPNEYLELCPPVSEAEVGQMLRLLGHRYIKLTKDLGETAYYGLTKSGEEAVQNSEPVDMDELVKEVVADTYPALFENKVTGVVVLAINPTCGTIVKEATIDFEVGQYPLYIGTFQTCFQPFFDKTIWRRVKSVAINL